MFKFYKIVVANSQVTTELVYKLNESLVTKHWSQLINQVTPKDIRPHSMPWRGIVKDWPSKVRELDELIKKLNTWIPNKIQYNWDTEDEHESLNRLHIHFPELELSESDPNKREQLGYYNDLVHEMQSLLNIRKRKTETLQLIICPEKNGLERIPFDLESFKEFDHNVEFGNLVLHYCHVGRSPYDILLNNDTKLPKEQIVPQHLIYTYHSLKFFDLRFDREKFKNFYFASKLDWPYKYDDPKLALGYVKMGDLHAVNSDTSWSRENVFELVKQSDTILDWQVY